DSIKRVEIIGAVRKRLLPELNELPPAFMERVTAATTLQEIGVCLRELLGTSGTAASTSAAGPAAPPAPSASAPVADVDGTLVELVAERTGYPADMLDVTANLEADLGIDSIKRVEIIGAVRKRLLPELNELPPAFMERVTAATTLHEIADCLRELLGGAAASPPPADLANGVTAGATNGATHAAVADCPRCVAVPVPAAVLPGAAPTGLILLTDDGRGIAAAVEQQLSAAGVRSALLSEADLASAEAAAAAIERRRVEGPIGGVLHLAGLRQAPPLTELPSVEFAARIDAEVKPLLWILQALGADLTAAAGPCPLTVLAASIGGGDFGADDAGEAAHPWRGGLAGLLKTASREWPVARFRAVDFDAVPSPQQLLDELACDGPVEIGHRGGERLGLAPVRQAVDPGRPRVALPPGALVLVTGGGRGITAEVAQELAAQTQATMVLLGRSAPPGAAEDPRTAAVTDPVELRRVLAQVLQAAGERLSPRDLAKRTDRLLAEREIRRTLETIERVGATAHYVACDVRDRGQLAEVVERMQREHGPVRALVHGAGVIEDRLIADKTAASFDRVLGTKLDPLLHLRDLLDPAELRCCMLFSSVAGFFGNPGQGDYAAANEILNRLARRLQHDWQCPMVAMNWGPWRGAGMVTPEVARQFESRDVGMVTIEAGRRAAWDDFGRQGASDVRVLVGPGPWVDDAPVASRAATGPLLRGCSTQYPAAGVVEVDLELCATAHRFLADHCLDAKPVLPLTGALELLAEVAQAAEPSWHLVAVHDLRMFSGIVLDDGRRSLRLRAEPTEGTAEGGRWRVRAIDPRRPKVALYEATVELAATRPAPPAPSVLPPPRQGRALSAADCYDRYLFHGPAFQVIHGIRSLDEGGIDASLDPSGEAAAAGWLVDPMVLDAAPQLAIVWAREQFSTTPLPNRVATYRCFDDLSKGPIEALFRPTAESDQSNVKADVWFVRGGVVVGHMQGLEGAASAELNRLARSVLG
ncbi:MAG: SDR family NAD(P)-dependent oxidoreductase, partial [Planctomycetota bacterium]